MGTGTPIPGTTSAVDSPAAVAAAGMLMEGQFGNGNGGVFGNGSGVGMGLGLTPRMGTGFTPVAMQLTASQGGISAVLGAQDQEEERKRRIEAIVGMLSTKWGFVSQEGVERCARRLGLECLWDEGMGDGKRTLTIAGTGVIVDVEFLGEEVGSVMLQFEGSRESVKEQAAAGADVLRKDLRGEHGLGYVALDGFVDNLERLATMDRLGGGGVSCFDAVDGIYRSLERVFSWEAGKAKEQKTEDVEEEVMCRHSGRPRLHTKGRVGLSLQYWMGTKLLSKKERGHEAMDVDTTPTIDEEGDEIPIWAAIIECEASSADLHPSIKVSDDWVSEAVEKQAPIETNGLPLEDSPIDWQEPLPTFLSSDSPTNGAMDIEPNPIPHPKPPDVRFVAKFEPPVIVPLQLAIDIHESVGSPLAQESLLPTTYENLLFEDVDAENQLLPNPRNLKKNIISYDPTTEAVSRHKHKFTLFTQPQDFARAITHLPFSHPRQIIALLPTLRQWALTASILRRSFVSNSDNDASSPISNGHTNGDAQHSEPTTFQTIDAELADFMCSPLPTDPASSTSSSSKVRDIQITLTTTPLPRLNLHFPNPRHGGKLASVGFNVGLNGVIDGVDVDDGSPPWQQNGALDIGEEKGKEIVALREKVRKVLEVGEDIGVCVEWMVRG